MSTTQEEIETKLDELEQDQESQVNEQDQSKEETKAPGFISYDEWVAKGKDPADYKGENAYKAEYDRIQEIRDLKSTMNQVVSGMETWQKHQSEQMNRQIEQAKIDAQAELEKAKADEDIEAALTAQNKLNNIQNTPAPTQINPVIQTFANANPIINPDSDQFDPEFQKDMTMIQNGILDDLLGGDRSRSGELSQSQIDRSMKVAYKKAKELHEDKFKSPRNNRQSISQPGKRSSQPTNDTTLQLKSVPGNTKNPRDNNPATDIYEMLKKRDPKAAETFAKNVLGE